MPKQDHRPRVAAAKRERTRILLIECALHLFATKGITTTVVDDVVTLADVSRGTFYNYFKTHDDLVCAVLHELGNELLTYVEAGLATCQNPAEKLACAIRMVLHATRSSPSFARFASKIDLPIHHGLAMVYLPRDLELGMQSRLFEVHDLQAALDLVIGTVKAAIYSLAGPTFLARDYPEVIAYQVLRGLGIPQAQARELVERPIEPLAFPDRSLIARTRQPCTSASP